MYGPGAAQLGSSAEGCAASGRGASARSNAASDESAARPNTRLRAANETCRAAAVRFEGSSPSGLTLYFPKALGTASVRANNFSAPAANQTCGAAAAGRGGPI